MLGRPSHMELSSIRVSRQTPALSVICIATSLDMPSLDLLRSLAYEKNVSRDKWFLYGRTQLLVMRDGFIWHQAKARSIKRTFCERNIDCFERLHLSNIVELRFEFEYQIKYENEFSILVCRLHVITTYSGNVTGLKFENGTRTLSPTQSQI